jgi:thiamine transport system substrate-binding protein
VNLIWVMPAEEAMRRHSQFLRSLFLSGAAISLVTGAVACGDDAPRASHAACDPPSSVRPIDAASVATADTRGTSLTLLTHDSFAVTPEVFEQFTAATGIKVTVLQSGDAGQVVSQAVLTAGKPVADVLFGIDNTLLCRGVTAGVFAPYTAPGLADVADAYELDPTHAVTPIDVGDVCLNYAKSAYASSPPQTLDDLTTPQFKNAFVTQNPETSSPGMAFLLATIAKYGEAGFEDYWKKLRANGLEVTSGWTEAYNESFGAGKGPRSVVTSYATSPAADMMFADPPISSPTIGVVEDSCFRQVEFAGVLAGTKHPAAAAKLIDFMLSTAFQEDIPANMFVFPVNNKATLPPVFASTVSLVERPLTLSPAHIEAQRDDWTARWTKAVLR